jgi:hypothetical protein
VCQPASNVADDRKMVQGSEVLPEPMPLGINEPNPFSSRLNPEEVIAI